jgi:hypothetical protein
MKLCLQSILLIALAAGLILTYGRPLDEQYEPIPGTGPILEPHPIALRLCAKELIVQAVIYDGLSLLDAAALRRETFRLLPYAPDYAADFEPDDEPPITEAERFCRQVIYFVRVQTYMRPADEIVARLEAEYREWRLQGGDRLPDPAELVPSPADLLKLARIEWVAESRGFRRDLPPSAGGFAHCE